MQNDALMLCEGLRVNPSTARLFNLNFHSLEVYNFKRVKIIQIWQNEGQLFSNLADLMSLSIQTMFKM